MASNDEFIWTADSRWLGGFANLTAKENRRWWKSRRWLVQTLVWFVITNGLLFFILWVVPKIAAQQGVAEEQAVLRDLDLTGITVFLSTIGLAAAIGVSIIGQDALINEKNNGTAAWVLSKPASRSAFVLAKIAGNLAGILVTMVFIQGAVAYLQIWLATGTAYPLVPYLGALGMVILNLLFFFTLTLMLGALSSSRGLVIGLPLFLILGYPILSQFGAWIIEIMPWNLTTSLGTSPALSLSLVREQPLSTIMPLIMTGLWCILFTVVALWRFNREEF